MGQTCIEIVPLALTMALHNSAIRGKQHLSLIECYLKLALTLFRFVRPSALYILLPAL